MPRDADTVGMMLGYDGTVGPYLENEIKLTDPMQYFQAGVLVMNLEAFRYAFTVADMLSLSTVRVWRWLDQDILNMLADGNYVRVDMRWNTLMDWKGIRREKIIAQAPEELREQYEAARQDPAIVHYAGPDDRPWDYPDCDMGACFWDYAKRSAFADVLEERLQQSQTTVAGKLDRAKVSVIFKGIMPLVDKDVPSRLEAPHEAHQGLRRDRRRPGIAGAGRHVACASRALVVRRSHFRKCDIIPQAFYLQKRQKGPVALREVRRVHAMDVSCGRVSPPKSPS